MAVLTQGREMQVSAGGFTYNVIANAADTYYKGASCNRLNPTGGPLFRLAPQVTASRALPRTTRSPRRRAT